MAAKFAAGTAARPREIRFAELSDEALMDRYLSGDETAYAELVRRYERELFNYLRRMIADTALAEDVFQNTFLTLHVKRHMFRVGRPFRPWLYTLATNQAIDALRRNGRHLRPSLDRMHQSSSGDAPATLLDMVPSGQQGPSCQAEKSEAAGIVRASVEALPEHLRLAVVLSYYQGMKYKDIAEILEIPVGTVKSRLHAAINRLGDEWKRLGLVEPE